MDTFTFLCVYDMMRIVLLKWNGKMLVNWLSVSSGDVVHVFMSSFSEAADANITGSIMRASVWVVNKPTRLRHILTQRQAEVIFKLSFCGLIFTNTSGSVLTRVRLCVCVCVCMRACIRLCVWEPGLNSAVRDIERNHVNLRQKWHAVV